MRILFICHRLPFPPNRGGKIRPFNMIRHLGRKHSVVVASLAHSQQEYDDGAGLTAYCDEVIAEIVPQSARWVQALRALPTGTPSSVAYFRSPRLYKRIREKLAHTKFDLVFVHCGSMAQYVMDLQTGFRIMDFGDLDSAKWAEYSRWKPFPFSLVYWWESKKLRKYERNAAQRFDRCTVTSAGEKDEYETLELSTPCTLIPNGVDTNYFSTNRRPSGTNPSIVFLGRMDYFPNIDGVCYFAERILPLIRKEMPYVEFRIVGSNPSRRIRNLAKLPGILVTGHVPDVRAYIQDGAVAVAPLRIARGTQNKILESMAMGIPVVATPNAAKGVQALPGRDLIIAETPQNFADSAIALLQSQPMHRIFAQAARKQVERAHSWTDSMDILDSVLADRHRQSEKPQTVLSQV